jgi:hypothetical protein
MKEKEKEKNDGRGELLINATIYVVQKSCTHSGKLRQGT